MVAMAVSTFGNYTFAFTADVKSPAEVGVSGKGGSEHRPVSV
jgi:hypothetical protein